MLPVLDHSWNLSPSEAIALQLRLAGRVTRSGDCDLRRARLVLGTDVSYSKATDCCYGAAVLWDYRRGCVVEEAASRRPSTFPYVPGLLSFREAPALLDAIAKLSERPDLLMAEGQGLAHPRRFGLACHLGVLFDLPTVGCAKSRLTGTHAEPGAKRGARAALVDRGERIGLVLRTRAGVKPVFVSQGHRIDLAQCATVVLRLADRCRMPEVLRRAHALSNETRRRCEAGL